VKEVQAITASAKRETSEGKTRSGILKTDVKSHWNHTLRNV
jgi:hypothetical protein